MELALVKNIILVGCMVILYVIECIFPYFGSWQHKSLHALRNLFITVFNAIIANILFVPLILLVLSLDIGLFDRIAIAPIFEIILTILILDIYTYWMHVAFHLVPVLWRFHRMHHSDTEMDVTSGSRFHIGEHATTLLGRCLVFLVFGMKLEYILMYEIVFITNVLFHHANISIGSFDKYFRLVFTSPDMHKVHHSNIVKETNSNYTSLLSLWDRLFGTYRIVANPKRIVFGIDGLEDDQSVTKMLKTPFKP